MGSLDRVHHVASRSIASPYSVALTRIFQVRRVSSTVPVYTSFVVTDMNEGWRESILGAPRRLLVSIGSFSRNASPCSVREQLPKLPVPDLASTMDKYLGQVEVIAPNHLERTRQLVKNFLVGPGPMLQQRLLERQERTTNWATEWWLNDMYLSIRHPLPINSNPGIVLEPKKCSNERETAVFLARFVNALFDYQELADRNEIEVERTRTNDGRTGEAMCMAQHYKLLTTYRRPGKEIDEQLILDRKSSGDHVIVAHRNQFYSIPIRAPDGGRLTEMELVEQILKIIEAPADPRTSPVGALTAAPRSLWAKAREELIKSERNRRNLELIERCACMLCLDDDPLPITFNGPKFKGNEIGRRIGDRDETNMLHHALHGGGSRHFGANRWYDETLQIILGTDGFFGLNYEHSAGEAPALFAIIEQLEKSMNAMPPIEETAISSHLPFPEKLEWCLTEQSLNDIREATTIFDSLVEDLDLCVLRFDEYGKEFIKTRGISPDVYIQLILQLAYFRIHGRVVATYESGGLRRFALGRVDCIRSASKEALEWAKATCQDNPAEKSSQFSNETEDGTKRVQFTIYSEQRIRELFDVAVKRQTKEMKENIGGHGIDNHLLGLREIAKEIDESIPELFTDEAYRIVNHFALSTSQLTTSNETITGYGPVVPDGYGCGYNIRKDSLIFHVSAFHSDGRTSASDFCRAIECSLRETANMLRANDELA